jgi:hypothetical protein
MKPLQIASLILLACLLAAGSGPVRPAHAQDDKIFAGAAFHSLPPDFVCVGDSFQFQAGASADWPDIPPSAPGEIPLAHLEITLVDISAELGTVSPVHVEHYGDVFEFVFTYTAKRAGTETVTLSVNKGLATTIERFEVHEKCDYDVYLLTVMHLTADYGDGPQQTLSRVVGSGILKRDREGSQFLQGDGQWHLQTNMLTKPSMCVEWFMPPLLLDGPFELDGRLADEGDSLDVKLTFQPSGGPPVYHGNSVCVDEEGSVGEGWGIISGGDPSLAAQINTSYPLDGGSNQVEMEGKGMQMVESQAQVDYQAVLTLIPR